MYQWRCLENGKLTGFEIDERVWESPTTDIVFINDVAVILNFIKEARRQD